MGRLDGKITLVTGAARGIGAAIARAFVEEGAVVHVTDILTDAGTSLAGELGRSAVFERLDVRVENEWAAVTAGILRRRGRLDVVVNNAGISGFENSDRPHDPENASLEDWRAVHETNLDGVFLGCKYAIRAMRPARTGSIINMSSRSGLVGIPASADYASTKAAVRNHTKSVALWCAQQGLAIRCNSLHPAAILTPMWDPWLGSGAEREARMAAIAKQAPAGRFGRPEEVAAVALLLASDEAPYITGTEINIDGGILAGAAAQPG